MMSESQRGPLFPIGEARQIVKDLLAPNPVIYWTDFLITVSLGWAAFILSLNAVPFSPSQFIFFLVAALTLFRASVFIHELAHLRKDTFKAFHMIWNVLCGFPLLIPSFLYQGVHNDHHKTNLYGTQRDGEYLPFCLEGRSAIISYVLFSLLLPVLIFIRFVILVPISYCHNSLREMVLKRASSFSIDPTYRRHRDSLDASPNWRLQEFLAFLLGFLFIILIILGKLAPNVLILWYATSVVVFLINSLRTLAAHRYKNSGNNIMNIPEQILDSVNIPANPLAGLWAPVGLRFHATHHLIPDLPYHALGKAHRRLAEQFSARDLYNQTTCRGLWTALRRLWSETGQQSKTFTS